MTPSNYLRRPLTPVALFLALLLVADAVFVGVHLINEFSPSVNNRLYALHVDRSYSEVFQYVKMLWVGLILVSVGLAVRAPVYGGWALLFVYLILDDSMRIHEEGGAWLVEAMSIEGAFGLRGQDFGELAVTGSAALILLSTIFVLYFQSSQDAKNASRDLLLLLGILAFFGIFFDLVHVVLDGPWAESIFNLLEDGGEMLAVTLMTAYAFRLHLMRGAVPQTLLRAFWGEEAPVPSLRPSR